MKKKILRIILAIVILFIAYNTIWFAWSHIKYGKLSDGMKEGAYSGFITPRYVYSDDEKYDYLVKYPDYLAFTGNMSVGSPTTEENPFTDALIIWPKVTAGITLGFFYMKMACNMRFISILKAMPCQKKTRILFPNTARLSETY